MINIQSHDPAEVGSTLGQLRGFWEGYRIGYGEAARNRSAQLNLPLYNLHVAFITEGLFAVREGIVTGLTSLVSRVTVLNPDAEAIMRINELRPDLVIVLNGIHAFGPELSKALQSTGVKTAVWFVDDPYFSDISGQIAPYFDYIFTHELNAIPFYSNLGCPRIYYLPLAASLGIFHPMHVSNDYKSDVCFIGTGFWNRIAFFDELIPLLRGRRLVLIGGLWDRLNHFNEVAANARLEGASIEESAYYYNGASIVLNMHRAADDDAHNRNSSHLAAHSVNPRTFEIAACGTFQLTDVRDDLDTFYTPGLDIETYQSPTELSQKIEYFLGHEEERQRLACGAMKRTLKDYTYRNRLERLLLTVFPELSGIVTY
ncbi:MAG: glycosyltransferase [Gorillibacterium sp.]|nr:glycosyltransferase [Gorillibacterium sp.]